MSHRITGIYAHSVAANQEWAERLGRYDHLRRLAGAVNAPGNNIFDSQHIVAESTALRDATREFAAAMAEAREDLARNVPRDTATLLLADLIAIDVAMNDMTGEAERIFSSFQRREPAKAGSRMATMDHKYDVVHRAFWLINEHVRAVQTVNFHHQIAAARSVQRFEWAIGALILMMVGGATAYGYHLSRQAATLVEKREREQRLQTMLASEQRFRSLIERGSDIIVILDEGHIARYVGPSVVRVLGYRAEALVGNPVGTFIHPDDALREAISSGPVLDNNYCNNNGRNDIGRLRGSFAWYRICGWNNNFVRTSYGVTPHLVSRSWFGSRGYRELSEIRNVLLVTIMFSQTLGTALGDWTADTAGLGYRGGAIVFSAMLAILAAAYYRTTISRTTLFWAAFILTRPLGAVVGDFLDKPISHGAWR